MLFELRQALRGIGRNPGFTLLCGVTLALGIGASTAVFSVVNGVLLEPLRFPHAGRIVSVTTMQAGRATVTPRLSGGDYVDVRDTNEVFDAISTYAGGEMGVQVRGQAEFTGVWFVNSDFFAALGQQRPEGAVVSADFAARHFGGPAQARGQQVRVEDRVYTVTGVLDGARFPEKAEVWLPAPYTPENLNRTAYNYRVIARLKPGVSLEQAQANLTTIAARNSAGKKTFIVKSLREQLVGPVRQTLYLLLGAVFLVLLIACANVSNLLLARATVRAREIAVRAALGATRARIVKQLVIESAVLGVAGGIGGIGLAWWGTRALMHFAPATLPRAGEIQVNIPVLGFALALSLLSALLFGAMPALQASRAEFGARGALKGGSHKLRNSLVIAEIALSFVLATGAGLFFRSFLALNAVDMGFRSDKLLVMYAHAPAKSLENYVVVGRNIVEGLLPRVSAIPGVESSGAAMGLPTGQYGSDGYYAVPGKHVWEGGGQKLPQANFSLSSPNYFATLGVPVLRGRDFTLRDRYGAPGVAIVSRALVQQVFGTEDPLGRQVVCGLDEFTMKPMEIVGVVGDVRQISPGLPPEPTLYFPLEQHPYHANEVQVIVRTASDPGSLTGFVRSAAHQFNPDMAVRFTTLDDMVSESISAPRFRTFVAGTFGGLALLLAMAGIYGVMTYMVTQRTGELGLRMALGAAASDVVGLVMRRAALLAIAGLGIGTALSVACSRLIGSLLFGVNAMDGSTYAIVFVAIFAVVALAAAMPSWRAARIDPLMALREE